MKKSKIYDLEEKLVTLNKIKCSIKAKKKLRKAAKDWIKWIKQHIADLHDDGMTFKSYHQGQIDMLEIFFNIKSKNEQSKK